MEIMMRQWKLQYDNGVTVCLDDDNMTNKYNFDNIKNNVITEVTK